LFVAAADWILTTIEGEEAFEPLTVVRLREIQSRGLMPALRAQDLGVLILELERRNAATVAEAGYSDAEADERAAWLGCERKSEAEAARTSE
jgi:hypothetical protein